MLTDTIGFMLVLCLMCLGFLGLVAIGGWWLGGWDKPRNDFELDEYIRHGDGTREKK